MLRLTTAALLAFASTTAVAQLLPSNEVFGVTISTECQLAVLEVLNNESIAQCLPLRNLVPALAAPDSIIPDLDEFMSQVCYTQPCSDAALDEAAQAISAGCRNDLQQANLPDSIVNNAFNTYPLVRELLCLKTTNEYTEESYGGFLGPAPVPINEETYNSTDGYFCVTSLLTQYSAYLDADLTGPYILSVAQGQNDTARDLVKSTNPNALCNDCIFAGLSLIDNAYPQAGETQIKTVLNYFGMDSNTDTTVNGYANETCAYNGQAVSPDGELPETVTVSIVDSTYDETYSS